jgi:hypothetical protein
LRKEKPQGSISSDGHNSFTPGARPRRSVSLGYVTRYDRPRRS